MHRHWPAANVIAWLHLVPIFVLLISNTINLGSSPRSIIDLVIVPRSGIQYRRGAKWRFIRTKLLELGYSVRPIITALLRWRVGELGSRIFSRMVRPEVQAQYFLALWQATRSSIVFHSDIQEWVLICVDILTIRLSICQLYIAWRFFVALVVRILSVSGQVGGVTVNGAGPMLQLLEVLIIHLKHTLDSIYAQIHR